MSEKRKVLIVDDSLIARLQVRKVIAKFVDDYEILEASGAEEAIRITKFETIDAAVLDYNIPELDGISLSRELRQITPELPVALITGNRQEKLVEIAKEEDLHFISKPLAPGELGDYLSSLQQFLAA